MASTLLLIYGIACLMALAFWFLIKNRGFFAALMVLIDIGMVLLMVLI
jgi:hypothetical protein